MSHQATKPHIKYRTHPFHGTGLWECSSGPYLETGYRYGSGDCPGEAFYNWDHADDDGDLPEYIPPAKGESHDHHR